ncbi:hypothetical protein [Glycomyces buryatensis]|uniref:Protein kinase domain-containing protein n=1 Tax=Glycomyces buryatensis TaxID=2570927 RepID=A0A4S8QF42_9ACTN|nr:hypothetical protein [Glycomyces buryatensis]THV43277.1 hypothetical protein FAB82_02085 [Glycomyces buryatensis]
MTYQDEPTSLEELGQLTKLADGGQGTVHRAALMPGELYKRYHNPQELNVAELKRLVRRVYAEPMPEHARELILHSTAWPTGVVLEQGKYTGMTMPEAASKFTAQIGGRSKLQELQYLIFGRKPIWGEGLVLPNPDQRRELVLGFVRLFKALHDVDIIIGDVSPRNFLWSVEPHPTVYALDCDGFRVNGYDPPTPQAQTPDWEDPDQETGRATFESDRFKLALLVIRVLLTEPKTTPKDVASDPVRRAQLGDRVAELAVRVADGERCHAVEWLHAFDNRPTLQFDPVKPPPERGQPGPRKGPDRPTLDFG